MNALSDLEFQILDEAYFVSSYQTILQNVGCPEEDFKDALIGMIGRELIVQLKFNSDKKDFEKLDTMELSSLTESHFVASRQGLLIHNSRN